MPQVQIQQFQNILARMLARVATRTGVTDFEDSSIVKQILAAAAREIDDSNYQLTRLQDLFTIDRAAGPDLDARAAEILPTGLTRVTAQRAVGYLVFSRAVATGTTIIIPVGTRVRDSVGAIYQTTQQGTITPTSPEQIAGHGVGRDSGLISAIALAAGSRGNLSANTVNQMLSRPAGVVEVTNPTAFVLGRDRETDAEFRNRIRLYVASLAACTSTALEFAALGQLLPSGQQVRFSHVVEDITRPGYVQLFIDDGAGTAEQYLAVAPAGTGGAVSALVGLEQTFTAPTGIFLPEHVGRTFTVSGAVDPDNNGTFTITQVLGTTQITYNNTNPTPTAETLPALATFAVGPEVVVASALGGEEYLNLDHFPLRLRSGVTITSSIYGVRTAPQVTVNGASGLLYFNPPLIAGEQITASYTYFTGLVAQVQRVIDGDPLDRLNFPGIRAAGTTVSVLTPRVVPQTVQVVLSILQGFSVPAVRAAVQNAVASYINGLGISGDIVRHELVERIMGVAGVYDCQLNIPAANITVLDDELARIAANDIDVL